MSTAWIATVTKQTQGETIITDRTTVYAGDQIEATKLGIAELGTTNITVTAIPAEHGGHNPTDAELNALQQQYRDEVGGNPEDLQQSMGGASGQAYG
jgi:hypothetical protein